MDDEEYLDPDLDPVAEREGGDEWWLPGRLRLAHLVAGVHVMTALAVLPFIWLAVLDDNLPQILTLSVLMGLLLVTAVVTGRIADRRFG